MNTHRPSRLSLGAAFLLLLWVRPALGRQHHEPPPPIPKPSRPTPPRPGEKLAPNQGHLAQWIENHKNLSPADQLRALESEPGFHDLPPQTQQNVRDRLAQLNSMNPQQRERTLDRTEALERLTPQQRQEWRGAVQQLTSLPAGRRALAVRAVTDLGQMPPEQRDQVIDSDRFRSQFSDGERTMIRTLLMAEPYHASNDAP